MDHKIDMVELKKPNKNMSVRSRSNSFVYAFNGIRILLQEPNAKLHAVATVVAVAAGFARHITNLQWIVLSIAIGMVWTTEAINTCLENLCDYACNNEIHPAIKKIKDVAAGAVLIAALFSVIIGIIIFFF